MFDPNIFEPTIEINKPITQSIFNGEHSEFKDFVQNLVNDPASYFERTPYPGEDNYFCILEEDHIQYSKKFTKEDGSIEFPIHSKEEFDILPNTMSRLYECGCFTSQRDTGVRKAIEDETTNFFETFFIKDSPIRVLSHGAEGLFQELIILFRLVLSGFKDIHLSIISPTREKISTQAFEKFIDRVKLCYSINVELNIYNDISELMNEEFFDVILAIDYEDAKFHFDMRGTNKNDKYNNNTITVYKPIIDLIKAASMRSTNDAKPSMFLIHEGHDIFIHKLDKDNNYSFIHKCLPLPKDSFYKKYLKYNSIFDYPEENLLRTYISSNIGVLIFMMDEIIYAVAGNEKKRLFINSALFKGEDDSGAAAVIKYLELHGIKKEKIVFCSEDAFMKLCESCEKDKEAMIMATLIIDCTIINKENYMSPLPEKMHADNCIWINYHMTNEEDDNLDDSFLVYTLNQNLIKRISMQKSVQNYCMERKNNSNSYKSFASRFFGGHSRNEKIQASELIIQSLQNNVQLKPEDLPNAAKKGELGKIMLGM